MQNQQASHNYKINVLSDSPQRSEIPAINQLTFEEREELRQKQYQQQVRTQTEDLDGRLELLFNRINFLRQQVSTYDQENQQVKKQMDDEIARNKEVEEVVTESIADVNQELLGLNSIVEQIAAKKAFLEKAVNQIKVAKLVKMESDFMKNENKNLKQKVEELNKIIEQYKDNEKELLKKQENIYKDRQEVIQQNEFIKNTFALNQVQQLQIEQELSVVKASHIKLLKDYETLELEYKKLKK